MYGIFFTCILNSRTKQMRLTTFLIALLYSYCIYADAAFNNDLAVENNVDSLLALINESNSKEENNEIYISIALKYLKVNDSLVNVYCQKVLLSNPLASKFHLGKAHYLKAMVLVNQSDFAESISGFEKAIKLYEEIKVQPAAELGSSYLSLGRARRLGGNNFLALKYITKALEYYKEVNDQQGVANCTNHIGIIYHSLGNDEKAKEYYLKCQDLYESFDNSEGRVYLLNNLGYIEEEAGNFEEALKYYHDGLSLAKSVESKMMEVHLMSNLANINTDSKNFKEAEKMINEGLKLAKERNNSRLYQFFKISRAKLFLKRDNSTRYMTEAMEVLSYAKEKKFSFLTSVTEEVLKDMYLIKGDFRKAYNLAEKIKIEKDSINSKQVATELAFLDSKLKSEAQLNFQKLDSQKNQFSKKLGGAISIFLFLMTMMFGYFARRLKKSNDLLKEKNHLLEEKDADLEKSSKELEVRNQKLQMYIESNTQLEKFARATSHDIKTPLRTITSFAGLLEKQISSKIDEKESEYLSYIIDGTKRLGVITNDLLNSSDQNQKLNLEYFDIRELLDKNLKDLAFVIQQTKAQIHIGDLPRLVYADKIKIRRVIQNLVENAIKYSSPGVIPDIHINCYEKENSYDFCVSDNGIGIKPEDHLKVFQTFTRVDGSNHNSGVGLGLSICKNNIEKHGGKIWVNPNYTGGTQFCFILPKKQKVESLQKASLTVK